MLSSWLLACEKRSAEHALAESRGGSLWQDVGWRQTTAILQRETPLHRQQNRGEKCCCLERKNVHSLFRMVWQERYDECYILAIDFAKNTILHVNGHHWMQMHHIIARHEKIFMSYKIR